MKNIKHIIKGHMNEITNSEDELYNERISICKECPLFKKTAAGPICNSGLYLNSSTDDVSLIPQEGYTRGCGCRLNAKTRLPESNCPVNKW